MVEYGRNQALVMAAAAGVPLDALRFELRRVHGDTFVLTDPAGAAVRAVEFLGAEIGGRARFLHTNGRAAARVDFTG